MEGYPRCQGIWDAPGGGGFCIFLPHPQKSPRDSQRVGRQGELPFKASGTNGVSREGAKVCSGVGVTEWHLGPVCSGATGSNPHPQQARGLRQQSGRRLPCGLGEPLSF